MSTTDIYAFDKNGTPAVYGSTHNSWRGGMAIWGILEEKYLPPYIPNYIKESNWYKPDMPYNEIVSINGCKPTRTNSLSCEAALKEIWNLFWKDNVSLGDKIVLGTTFDKVVVKTEDVPRVIRAFNEFGGETSLSEQAQILQSILDAGGHIAVAWNQTSVSISIWECFKYDEENDESIPYNLKNNEEHWFLFDALDEKGKVTA